jgi:GntR family transcriptional regulator
MKYKTIDELGEIRKRRGVAYYHQLYTLLSAALTDGVIPPGSALPSESELMKRFGVSRNTVRRAVGQLEQEKRVVCRRGSGSYARSLPKTDVLPADMSEVLHDFEGQDSSSRLLRVQSTTTPVFIRRKDPGFGEKSLLVQRCRSFKDEPFMFSTSYVPDSLAARLTRRNLTRHVVLSALDAAGVRPKSAEETTTAVTADAFTARHLRAHLHPPPGARGGRSPDRAPEPLVSSGSQSVARPHRHRALRRRSSLVATRVPRHPRGALSAWDRGGRFRVASQVFLLE